MSLIQTCQLYGANAFDALVELQRHTRIWSPVRGMDAVERLRYSGAIRFCPALR
jgi:hypothetical protein